MFAKHKVITTIAVHDLQNAIDFYGEILGMQETGRNMGGVVFESGGGLIGLYESPTAGSNQGTSAWWTVDDVPAAAEKLKARGIAIEKNYDLPYAERDGDIYLLGDDAQALWFKDPDGNILGLGNF